MNINLEKKTVVITGSSRGIGKEIAIRFSSEGANVVINYKSNQKQALETLLEIQSYNPRCIMIKADVTKIDQVQDMYEKTIKYFGGVDILINNAGICNDNLINLMTEEQWRDVIDTNLNSVFLCSKFFSKAMIHNKEGKIINISSLKGQIGNEGQVNYCASKAGIIGFTKALAKELGHFNIAVNAVSPGFIVTDLNRHDEKKKEIAKNMSLLQDYDLLENLLNFILFLSSEQCNGISGQVFNIDSRIR